MSLRETRETRFLDAGLSITHHGFLSQPERCPVNCDEIRLLYDYNSWANARTLEACGALDLERLTAVRSRPCCASSARSPAPPT